MDATPPPAKRRGAPYPPTVYVTAVMTAALQFLGEFNIRDVATYVAMPEYVDHTRALVRLCQEKLRTLSEHTDFVETVGHVDQVMLGVNNVLVLGSVTFDVNISGLGATRQNAVIQKYGPQNWTAGLAEYLDWMLINAHTYETQLVTEMRSSDDAIQVYATKVASDIANVARFIGWKQGGEIEQALERVENVLKDARRDYQRGASTQTKFSMARYVAIDWFSNALTPQWPPSASIYRRPYPSLRELVTLWHTHKSNSIGLYWALLFFLYGAKSRALDILRENYATDSAKSAAAPPQRSGGWQSWLPSFMRPIGSECVQCGAPPAYIGEDSGAVYCSEKCMLVHRGVAQ